MLDVAGPGLGQLGPDSLVILYDKTGVIFDDNRLRVNIRFGLGSLLFLGDNIYVVIIVAPYFHRRGLFPPPL